MAIEHVHPEDRDTFRRLLYEQSDKRMGGKKQEYGKHGGDSHQRSARQFHLCHRAWRVLSCLVDYSGLPMWLGEKTAILLVNEGRGFGN